MSPDDIAKMWDVPVDVLSARPQVTYSGLLAKMNDYLANGGKIPLRPDPVEPAKLSDCPHKPGTIEHRDWIREHVIERQRDPRTQAHEAELVRIGTLGAGPPRPDEHGPGTTGPRVGRHDRQPASNQRPDPERRDREHNAVVGAG